MITAQEAQSARAASISGCQAVPGIRFHLSSQGLRFSRVRPAGELLDQGLVGRGMRQEDVEASGHGSRSSIEAAVPRPDARVLRCLISGDPRRQESCPMVRHSLARRDSLSDENPSSDLDDAPFRGHSAGSSPSDRVAWRGPGVGWVWTRRDWPCLGSSPFDRTRDRGRTGHAAVAPCDKTAGSRPSLHL